MFCIVCGSPLDPGKTCTVCAVGDPPFAPSPEHAAPRERGSEPPFPLYPGATTVKSGHVNGGPAGHIQWAAYHTPESQDRVVTYYATALGSETRADRGDVPRFRDSHDKPNKVLEIYLSGARGPWGNASVPAGGCVILMSTMTR